MTEALPKIIINSEMPLHTTELHTSDEFRQAESEGLLPDVQLLSAPLNPRDRPHRNALRIGIHDENGELVGSLNLLQTAERSWINDAKIDKERQGERLAVSAYAGIIATLHGVGRTLESDPGGLSGDSARVWESLQRRGLAESVEGKDQHGNARFISKPPTLRE